MDRRSFLRTAGAAAVTPLLPMPSLAAAPAAAVNEFQMGWATLLSRVHAQATPELIQRWLRISPAQANSVMKELVSRGVVHSPVAGSAVAVKPMYGTSKVRGFVKQSRSVADKVTDLLKENLTEQESGPEEDSTSEFEEIGIDPTPEMQEVGPDSGGRAHGLDGEDIGRDER